METRVETPWFLHCTATLLRGDFSFQHSFQSVDRKVSKLYADFIEVQQKRSTLYENCSCKRF